MCVCSRARVCACMHVCVRERLGDLHSGRERVCPPIISLSLSLSLNSVHQWLSGCSRARRVYVSACPCMRGFDSLTLHLPPALQLKLIKYNDINIHATNQSSTGGGLHRNSSETQTYGDAVILKSRDGSGITKLCFQGWSERSVFPNSEDSTRHKHLVFHVVI